MRNYLQWEITWKITCNWKLLAIEKLTQIWVLRPCNGECKHKTENADVGCNFHPCEHLTLSLLFKGLLYFLEFFSSFAFNFTPFFYFSNALYLLSPLFCLGEWTIIFNCDWLNSKSLIFSTFCTKKVSTQNISEFVIFKFTDRGKQSGKENHI